jgi:hypothetical protein
LHLPIYLPKCAHHWATIVKRNLCCDEQTTQLTARWNRCYASPALACFLILPSMF